MALMDQGLSQGVGWRSQARRCAILGDPSRCFHATMRPPFSAISRVLPDAPCGGVLREDDRLFLLTRAAPPPHPGRGPGAQPRDLRLLGLARRLVHAQRWHVRRRRGGRKGGGTDAALVPRGGRVRRDDDARADRACCSIVSHHLPIGSVCDADRWTVGGKVDSCITSVITRYVLTGLAGYAIGEEDDRDPDHRVGFVVRIVV